MKLRATVIFNSNGKASTRERQKEETEVVKPVAVGSWGSSTTADSYRIRLFDRSDMHGGCLQSKRCCNKQYIDSWGEEVI